MICSLGFKSFILVLVKSQMFILTFLALRHMIHLSEGSPWLTHISSIPCIFSTVVPLLTTHSGLLCLLLFFLSQWNDAGSSLYMSATCYISSRCSALVCTSVVDCLSGSNQRISSAHELGCYDVTIPIRPRMVLCVILDYVSMAFCWSGSQPHWDLKPTPWLNFWKQGLSLLGI